MRVFLDTNVLLEVFLKRVGEPASASVISACGGEENQGFVAVTKPPEATHASLNLRKRTIVEDDELAFESLTTVF